MAESVLHVGAVTMRLNGAGNLDMVVSSLDDQKSEVLRSFVMNALTAIEPTRLSNFKSQRFSLEISTDEIDEYFMVNRVVFWIREIYKSLPSRLNA